MALNPWGDWYGANATSVNGKFTESPIGGAIADTTRKLYSGRLAQWPTFRRIDGRSPYITPDPHGVEVEENIILSYLPLSAGPLGKDVTTMAGAWAQLAISIG